MNLLGGGVLGDGLCTLRHGVLGQFSGEKQPDGGLYFPGRDGGPLVVVCKARSLAGDTFKDVVNERVHDGHRLAGNTSVGMDLFQDLVDVDRIRLAPLLALLFISFRDALLGLTGLLRSLSRCFGCHVCVDGGRGGSLAF